MKKHSKIPRVNYVIAGVCALGILINLVTLNFDMMTNSMLFLGLLLVTVEDENSECKEQEPS